MQQDVWLTSIDVLVQAAPVHVHTSICGNLVQKSQTVQTPLHPKQRNHKILAMLEHL